MSDRGEYRSVRRVLLDGPDFRRLSERARWVFVALKLNLGPSGIETFEPEALVVTLSAQTGVPVPAVKKAVAELEAAHWIAREANLVWVIGQLEHDPHVRLNDAKHRKSIQRYVAGLPRLAIRDAYVRHYAAWFADSPTEAPSTDATRPTDGPSMAHRSREEEKEKESEDKSNPPTPPAAVAGRLVSDADRVLLAEILATVNRPSAWEAEIAALMDGMRSAPVSPERVGEGMRDFVAAGHLEPDAKLSYFRGFIENAGKRTTRTTPRRNAKRPTPQTYAYANPTNREEDVKWQD